MKDLIVTQLSAAVAIDGSCNAASRDIIKAELGTALASGGSIASAIEPIRAQSDASASAVEDLRKRIGTIEKEAQDLDDKYPFRKFERSCEAQVWSFGWRRLRVDQDYLTSLADNMGDASVAQTLALCAAHPGNSQLGQLKDAVALKNAPRHSWRCLCLPASGGSIDKLRSFLMDRADDADRTIAAIARKCLAFVSITEKRYTSAPSAKKTSNTKIAAQKVEMMHVIFHGLKHLQKLAKKAGARDTLDGAMLKGDFSEAFSLAIAKVACGSASGLASSLSAPSDTVPFQRRPSTTHDETPGAKRIKTEPGVSPGGESKRQHRSHNADLLEQELTEYAKTHDAKEIQKWIDGKFQSSDTKSAMGTVMNRICRNCALGGRGIVRHTLSQCRSLGNPPNEPCPFCLKKGWKSYHWRSDCKYGQ